MQLFSNCSSNPKWNAQRNLAGRTHYVDDSTLRFHHARVLFARAVDNGLLFAIVESVAIDMHNTKRGFRYVIFDVFGNTVERNDLDDCWKSRDAASKAMWKKLDELDAHAITAAAIDQQERRNAYDITEARATLAKITAAKDAA